LGVGVDAAGNVYVADAITIVFVKYPRGTMSYWREVPPWYRFSRFADGMGAAAKFSTPNGVVIDASGNVYVTDAGNYLIRKLPLPG